jgi:hypothetical protein
MNDELLKEIIADLAWGILYGEYGKDRRNVEELRLLALGRFEEYAVVKSQSKSE